MAKKLISRPIAELRGTKNDVVGWLYRWNTGEVWTRWADGLTEATVCAEVPIRPSSRDWASLPVEMREAS